MSFATVYDQLSEIELGLLEALETCKKQRSKEKARAVRERRVTRIFWTLWMPLSGYPWIYGEGAGGAELGRGRTGPGGRA